MRPAVDVVIVSHNTREDLGACLASLAQHSPDPLGAIFVVDNASSDGSADLVRRRWPTVRVIVLDRNAGFAAANNVAMRQAEAPLLLLLNSDTLVGPGALDVLTDRLVTTGAVAAGPRLIGADGRPEVSFGPMLSPFAEVAQMARVRLSRARSGFARRYVDRLTATERDVDWVSGACLLVHREAALATGLFDERYFMYEEDVDFCAALRASGGRILYTPRATITHLRGRSIAATAAPAAGPSHYDRSHVAFYEKHAPRWTPLLRAWLRLRGRGIR